MVMGHHSVDYFINDRVIRADAYFIQNKLVIKDVSAEKKLLECSLNMYDNFFGDMKSFVTKVVELKNKDMGQTRVVMEIKKINKEKMKRNAKN